MPGRSNDSSVNGAVGEVPSEGAGAAASADVFVAAGALPLPIVFHPYVTISQRESSGKAGPGGRAVLHVAFGDEPENRAVAGFLRCAFGECGDISDALALVTVAQDTFFGVEVCSGLRCISFTSEGIFRFAGGCRSS